MIDPQIFEDLQNKIDEDANVREQIRVILQTLERQERGAQSVLSRAHATPAAERKSCYLIYLSRVFKLNLMFSEASPGSCREGYQGRS